MTSYKWLHSIPRETNDKVTVNKKNHYVIYVDIVA